MVEKELAENGGPEETWGSKCGILAGMRREGLGDAKVTVAFATFGVVQFTSDSSPAAGRICGVAGLATKIGGPDHGYYLCCFPSPTPLI